MTDWKRIEGVLVQRLALRRRPVAVAYLERPPAGVEKFAGSQPSGCSFWFLAAEGKAFYTVPRDHYNCAIGSYTHNIPLPPERAKELDQTLELMTGIGYLRMEEVPGIPRLEKSPGAVVYAPLGETPVEPDAVITSCKPANAMLLQEAAVRAGEGPKSPVMGRPTCMSLPVALSGGIALNVGCIGNRVYTGIPEDEMYAFISGRALPRVAAELETIASANAKLEEYHENAAKGARVEVSAPPTPM